MTSWRDVQAGAEQIRREKRWQPARVVGVDGAWMRGTGVMVAVDLGDGQPLAIGAIDEKDMAGVTRWLKRLKQEHNIGAIVTDDLGCIEQSPTSLGWVTRCASFMYAVGWGRPAGSWGESCLKNGCG
jgi:hypothetical protein